jgi:hypothetical protein
MSARPPSIDAIETEYQGVRFRSRAEARWAVFFDALGVRWAHEHEPFDLASGRYLPDYWLPELETFVEIKGTLATPREKRLCAELAFTTGRRVVLFPYEPGAWLRPSFAGYASEVWFGDGDGDIGHVFCVCLVCGRIGVEYEGHAERICGDECCGEEGDGDRARVEEAARRANGHRFWDPDRRPR